MKLRWPILGPLLENEGTSRGNDSTERERDDRTAHASQRRCFDATIDVANGCRQMPTRSFTLLKRWTVQYLKRLAGR